MTGNSEFFPAESSDNTELLISTGATCEITRFRKWDKWFLRKRLREELRSNPFYVAALEKEFDLGIHCDHPGLVRFFDKGHDEKGPYLVEEYIDGESLSSYLEQNAPLSRKETVRIFNELASVVSYLHSQGIIHCDLKPDNILLTRQGNRVKLIDLGFSCQYSYSGIWGGSTQWTAPELKTEPNTATFQADIYSLGRILEALNGKQNRKIVSKATATSLKERYKTPEEMIRALQPQRWWRQLLVIAGVILLSLPGWLVKNTRPTTASEVAMSKDTITVQGLFQNSLDEAMTEAFKPLYSSYDSLSAGNIANVMNIAQECLGNAMTQSSQMADDWGSKYPEYQQDFSQLIMPTINHHYGQYMLDLSLFSLNH